MEIKASATYLRISPRKLRILTAGLRGLTPESALMKLNFQNQHGKIYLEKVIKQAVANAVNNFKLVKENLKIEKLEVGEGPRMKRMDKSHGARFDRGIIQKRTAHLSITLNEEQKEVVKGIQPKIAEEIKKVVKKKVAVKK